MFIMNYNCFFIYNGKGYRAGTVIKLKQEYIDTHLFNGYKIWKYAYLSNKNCAQNKYVFNQYRVYPCNKINEYAGLFLISQEELEDAIEEIIEPREVEIVPKTKRRDWESNEVMVGWIIYIVALFASLIFREWYIAWLFGSIYFFTWRNGKLWED